MGSVIVIFLSRCLLVALFLPFSALDKLLNRGQAIEQASTALASRPLAIGLLIAGGGLEISMSVAILSGIADRAASCALALYCILTALLFKRFWLTADFSLHGASKGRDVFWDFMKNLALAGGFLMLALGTNAAGVAQFLAHPLTSSHPYEIHAPP